MAKRFRLFLAILPITGALFAGLLGMPSVALSRTPSQAIEEQLQGLDSGLVVNAATRRVANLQAFYRARKFRPLWIENGTSTGKANAIRRILANAAQDGLDPTSYHAVALASGAPGELGRFDVALSAAVLRYVGDLRNGRVSPG